METVTSPDTAKVIYDIAVQHAKPEVIEVKPLEGDEAIQVLIMPDGKGGKTAQSTREFTQQFLTKPERREGCARFTTLESLIDHINRFKDDDSAVFANNSTDTPAITAILDYHKAGANKDPRFCNHRSHYPFPLSEEWKAWAEIDGSTLDMIHFAEFLEDRIVDVMPVPTFLTSGTPEPDAKSDQELKALVAKINGKPCGPDKLMQLSKEVKINESGKAEQSYNTQSGETGIRFKSEHTDDDGKPVKIPDTFLIAIPVFKNGPAYRLLVRLRYRLRNGSVVWSLTRHRPDLAQEHAIKEACDTVAEKTALPIFYGTPE